MYPVKYFLNTDYQEMEVLGVTGLFSNLRVERESLPEGIYKYSLREGDEDFFSTVEEDVLVNHSGDFLCKTELKLGEDGFKVLGEDYGFTYEPVDLDKFFGVDIKLKVAEALDSFMKDFDPYHYSDCLEIDQTDHIDSLYLMLCNRDQAEGLCAELKEICEEGRFESDKLAAFAEALFEKVEDIVCSFPEKKIDLSEQIEAAEVLKGKSLDDSEQLEPEVEAP